MIALPVAYQVFRMGFYGSLVPGTAVAKEGGSANLSRGWDYLLDFAEPYWLWFAALVMLAGGYLPMCFALVERGRRRALLVVLTFAGIGVVNAAYLTRCRRRLPPCPPAPARVLHRLRAGRRRSRHASPPGRPRARPVGDHRRVRAAPTPSAHRQLRRERIRCAEDVPRDGRRPGVGSERCLPPLVHHARLLLRERSAAPYRTADVLLRDERRRPDRGVVGHRRLGLRARY